MTQSQVSAQTLLNKGRTKIPVYLNQNATKSKPVEAPKRTSSAGKFIFTILYRLVVLYRCLALIKCRLVPLIMIEYNYVNVIGVAAATGPLRNKTERKVPGSLMNATKSSSAKVVQRVQKEPQAKDAKTKKSKSSAKPNREQSSVPAMGRSGTFLKDEPTFGEKTTNLDIDEQ